MSITWVDVLLWVLEVDLLGAAVLGLIAFSAHALQWIQDRMIR